MKETTLCYIENAGCYLMMHRIKKKNDENSGKWIGIGGKIENDETPTECVIREIYEETGLVVTGLCYRGTVMFVSDIYEDELMHLFTAESKSRNVKVCDEGELAWINKDDVMSLNLWEGDRVFLKKLIEDERDFFHIVLGYEGDNLKYIKEESNESQNN